MLARHCSDREQRAEAAERDLTKLKLLAYLSTRIGEEMDAVVTGVESYGIFVQGVKLPAEGLVRVESLSDDRYYFDRACTPWPAIAPVTAIVSAICCVAVARVDLERREVDFQVVQRAKSKPVGARGMRKSRKGGRAVEKTTPSKKREPAASNSRPHNPMRFRNCNSPSPASLPPSRTAAGC